MADTIPGVSPLQRALSQLGAAPQQDQALTVKDAFDGIARETRVPANVLIALDEATGGRGDAQRARQYATQLAQVMSKGGKLEEAMLSVAGGDPARAKQILDRSYDIADALYPSTAPAPAPDAKGGGPGRMAVDLGKTAAGAAVSGAGSALHAAGVAGDDALRGMIGVLGSRPTGGVPEPVEGETILRRAGRAAGAKVDDAGRAIAESASPDFLEAMRGTQMSGELFSPSTWDMGDNPSATGLAGHVASGLGSMLPMLLTRNPYAAATMGGLMAGGEGAKNGRQFVLDAATVTDEAGQPEIAKLPAYRALIDSGKTHAQATLELAQRAESDAGFRQGIVGALGGAATNRIFRGADGWLGSGGRIASAAKKAAAGALEEGTQEAVEGAAAKSGIEAATGADLNLAEDSFANFALGALTGGAAGAAGGVLFGGGARGTPSEMDGEEPAPEQLAIEGPDGPLLLPPPDYGLPGPGGPLGALPPPDRPPLLPSPAGGGTIFGEGRPGPAPGDIERDPRYPRPPADELVTGPAEFRPFSRNATDDGSVGGAVAASGRPDLSGQAPGAAAQPLMLPAPTEGGTIFGSGPVGPAPGDIERDPRMWRPSPDDLMTGPAQFRPGQANATPPALGAAPPPAGPIAALAQTIQTPQPQVTAPPRFPEYKPGAKIRLGDPETGRIFDAIFLGETPDGARIRVAGQEVDLRPEDLDMGRDAAVQIEAAQKVPGKSQMPPATVTPTPAPQAPAPQAPAPGAPAATAEENPPRIPARPKLQKKPFTNYVKRAWGVNPTGKLAEELRHLGVTYQTAPGLFRRNGRKELDNIVASENPELIGAIRVDPTTGYFEPDSIIEALAEEAAGRPLAFGKHAEDQQLARALDEYERDAERQARADADPLIEPYEDGIIPPPDRDERDDEQRRRDIGAEVDRIAAGLGMPQPLTEEERIYSIEALDRAGGVVHDAIHDAFVRSNANAIQDRDDYRGAAPEVPFIPWGDEGARGGAGPDAGAEGGSGSQGGRADGAGELDAQQLRPAAAEPQGVTPPPASDAEARQKAQDKALAWLRNKAKHAPSEDETITVTQAMAREDGIAAGRYRARTFMFRGQIPIPMRHALRWLVDDTDFARSEMVRFGNTRSTQNNVEYTRIEREPVRDSDDAKTVRPQSTLTDSDDAKTVRPQSTLTAETYPDAEAWTRALIEAVRARVASGRQVKVQYSRNRAVAINRPDQVDDVLRVGPRGRLEASSGTKWLAMGMQEADSLAVGLGMPMLAEAVPTLGGGMDNTPSMFEQIEDAARDAGVTITGEEIGQIIAGMSDDGTAGDALAAFVTERDAPRAPADATPRSEPGADGLPQNVMPGMERSDDQARKAQAARQRAEMEARQQQSKMRRLDGNTGDAGPLFGEQQGDLLDGLSTRQPRAVKPADPPAARDIVGDSWDVWPSYAKEPMKKRVISTEMRNGERVYLVQMDGERTADILTAEQVEQEKQRDARNLETAQKNAERQKEADAREAAAKADREDLDGFTDGMTPMQAGKVIAALTAKVNNNGRAISRRDLVREKVRDGAVIEELESEGEILMSPNETFLNRAAITKTGLDYAKHLIARRDSGQAATEAAAQADPNPTEAQKEAGNYQKGHLRWNGLDLTIENAKGSERRGRDSDGEEWSVTMPAHYGYFKGTEGADGDHVDFYMGDVDASDYVMIIDQVHADTGEFDEHKVIIGTTARGAALETYLGGFSDGRGEDRIGNFTETNVATLKNWLATADKTKPSKTLTHPFRRAPIESKEKVAPISDVREAFRLIGVSIRVASDGTITAPDPRVLGGGSMRLGYVDDFRRSKDGKLRVVNKDPVAERAVAAWNDKSAAPAQGGGLPTSPTTAENQAASRFPTTLEEIARKPRAGEGRLSHIYAEYKGGRYYLASVQGNPEGPMNEWFKTYPQARILSTDRADGTSINGDIAELDAAIRPKADAPPPAATRSADDEGIGARWDAMSEAERSDVATRAGWVTGSGGLNPTGRKIVSRAWADHPETTIETLTRYMQAAGKPAKAATPGAGAKIEDFGEKLAGARKDAWASYADSMSKAEALDVDAVPLSKSWPAPDYEKMIEEGADPWVVGFIRAVRDEIPNKPSSAWKLKGWVDQVKLLRGMANKLTAGEYTRAQIEEKMAKVGGLSKVLRTIELYEAVGHSKSLKGIRIGAAQYSLRAGVRHDPPITVWEVQQAAKATAFSNMPRILAEGKTKEEAIAAFKARHGSLDTMQEKARKGAKFITYSRDGRKTWIVGVKIGSNYIDLRNAGSTTEARRLIAEESDALQAQLDRMRDIPRERRDENQPRVGIDHRSGADVTPEQFAEAFGFRGVQFGNWVEGGRRQQDLNQAFDALMDLAGVIGVPPRALSLHGTLGLAFGARGSGGKNPHAAHYEPDTVVINLTKNAGAGSLAHEWFHALDNYFAKRVESVMGRKSHRDYITENWTPGTEFAGVRPEVVDAFLAVRHAIGKTKMKARNDNLDKLRSKPYWGTTIEMHARAFESYVIAKLQDQGASNDYLANIVNGLAWAMKAEAAGLGDSYPYLKEDEIDIVRPAFDALFDVMQTRDTDTGPELYQRDMSGNRPVVASLTGDELGAWEDIRQLGRKAEAWYRKNLIGRSVIMESTGWEVRFGRVGSKKLGGRKGDILLRIVPALEQIIQKSDLVSTSPGAKPGTERQTFHKVTARVGIDGNAYEVVATLREEANGTFHYDLSMADGAVAASNEATDRVTEARGRRDDSHGSKNVDDAGSRGNKQAGGSEAGGFSSPTIQEQSRTSALDGGLAGINLDFATSGINGPATTDLRSISALVGKILKAHGLDRAVSPKVVRGLLSASGVPVLGAYRDGQIRVNANAADPGHVVRHEIIHALRDPALWGRPHGLFTQAEWRALVKAARADDVIREAIETHYRDKPASVQTEEMVAELYADWATNRAISPPGALGQALEAIQSFFRAMASALRGEGFMDAAAVMRRIERGGIGGRGPLGPGGGRRGAARGSDSERTMLNTATKAFRDWFGASKVVDADGKPLVVYHGSDERREVLKAGKSPGIWFTSYMNNAASYARGPDATLHDVYLSIENPMVVEISGDDWSGFTVSFDGETFENNEWENNDAIVEEAMRRGFDGVFFKGGNFTEADDTWVAFRPNQIKSVDNRGTFDPDDDRIMHQRAPLSLDAALIAGDLGLLATHPDYAAAKAGDVSAAVRVAQDVVTDRVVAKVRAMIGDRRPVIVPVVSEEASGRNKIPLAAAEVLAQRIGAEVAAEIVQSNAPRRTSLSGLDRIFASPEFDGPIVPDQDYLILDDTLTQGGTFAALAGHIEAGGGRVVGAVALTGKKYSAKLGPSSETLAALRDKHGDLEPDFRAATGYGFDSLTESEARHLTNFKPAERVRDRILAEGRSRRASADPGNDPAVKLDRRASDDDRTLYQRAFHGTPHDFDQFSLDAIGTGEGAQVFGWGLYFAGRREVSEYYRDTLAKRGVNIDAKDSTEQKVKGHLEEYLKEAGGWDDLPGLRDAIISSAQQYDNPDLLDAFDAMVEDGRIEVGSPEAGRLFTVDIPEDSDLLDWDARLADQPDTVRKALTKRFKRTIEAAQKNGLTNFKGTFDNMTGERLYKTLSEIAFNKANRNTGGLFRDQARFDYQTSEKLRAAGIPGHRYLDGSSRGRGHGSHNYVIYDDAAIEVLEKEQRDLSAIKARLSRSKGRALGMIGNLHWKRGPEVFTGWLSNKLTDAMGKNDRFNILGAVPGHPLFAELGKHLPGARTYLRLKQEMDAERNQWQAITAEVVDKWTELGRKNPAANDLLMDLMHRSTLAGIDPTVPDGWRRMDDAEADRVTRRDTKERQAWAAKVKADRVTRQATYENLRAEYAKLPKEFQGLYREARDKYSQLADQMDSALMENIRTAARIAVKRADREYRKEVERINDEGLTGDERREAINKANEARSSAHARAARGGAARVKQLRQIFEANRLAGPYFPLARFGNYFVAIRDASGKMVSFSRFEKASQQETFIRQAEADGLGKISRGVLTNPTELRGAVDPSFLADVEGILEEAGASREMMDAVWQRYLETLPDQSIRTNKIHRKGRAGFNKDAVRAFASAMFHGAHQHARLRYGMEMEEALNEAEEQAAGRPAPERAGFVVREMRQRHAFTMSPTNNPVVTQATSLAFIWYLGVSPAAALVNVSQTTVVGIPIMAARFQKHSGSMATATTRSIKALTQASRDFMRGRGKSWGETWSAENAPNLTADERAALHEAYRRGVIDKTQAYDLASVAESGVEYNPTREKVMRVIGWAFHHTERFNREVTFLANYRLLRDEAKGHDEAITEADALVKKIHFDYQNTSRPRAMQGDAAKVVTTFRAFTVNMLYRLFRDTHQAIKGADAETRREARAQLIGVTLSMMSHAGIRGVWGYGLLMGLLAIFMPGDGDDMDEWLQDALLIEGDGPGTAAWNWTMGLVLNGVPGQALGLNLTERLGMPNLWFRPPGQDLEGRDLWAYYMEQLAGPVFGIPGSVLMGVSRVSEGHYARGAESMVPVFARNVIRSGRYAAEGVTTYNGDELVDGLNPWQLLMQASGFTPAEVAERYEINNRLKKHERRIDDQRRGIVREIGDAVRAGAGIPEAAIERLRRFNTEYPEWPITPETIRASVRGRERASQRNEFGVSLNPRLNDRLRAERAPALTGG